MDNVLAPEKIAPAACGGSLPPSYRSRHHQRDRELFWSLIAVLLWVPWPWGSVEPWARYFLVAMTTFLAAIWLLLFSLGHVRLTTSFRAAQPVLIIWSILVLFVLAQALAPWLASGSPQAFSLYQSAARAGIAVTPVVSLEAHATLTAAALTMSYMLLFGLILVLVRNQQRLRFLAFALFINGVCQAVYGLFMSLSGIDYGFFAKNLVSHGVASGTFVNRNHFAGFLEMSLAVGIGLLVGGHRSHEQLHAWQDWLRVTVRFLLSEKALLRIGILIMALALILSRSRMGNSAFLISLTLIALVYVFRAHDTFRARMIILWVSIMVVDISFMGSYFGLEKLKVRLEETTATEVNNRVDISNHLQPYVLDFQPLGSGLGTFEKAFMPYLGPDMRVIYQGAENDYLQFLGELGGLAGLLPWLVLGSLVAGLRAVRANRPMLFNGMSFAAVMGIVALLIHSLVDFNLQIPANGVMFTVLLAVGWITAYQRLGNEQPTPRGHPR